MKKVRNSLTWFSHGSGAASALVPLGRVSFSTQRAVPTGEICFGLEVFLREENETGSCPQSRAKWVRGPQCDDPNGQLPGTESDTGDSLYRSSSLRRRRVPVLVDPPGWCLHFFSSSIPAHYIRKLLEKRRNPIYELEILPLVVRLDLWGDLIRDSLVVHYIDNDAAKASLIKGYGSTDVARRLVQRSVEQEERLQLKVWFSRVPSFSNLSDGPSRNDCSEVLSLGASQTIFEWERFDGLLH